MVLVPAFGAGCAAYRRNHSPPDCCWARSKGRLPGGLANYSRRPVPRCPKGLHLRGHCGGLSPHEHLVTASIHQAVHARAYPKRTRHYRRNRCPHRGAARAQHGNPSTIADLCRAATVSQRTLRHAFRIGAWHDAIPVYAHRSDGRGPEGAVVRRIPRAARSRKSQPGSASSSSAGLRSNTGRPSAKVHPPRCGVSQMRAPPSRPRITTAQRTDAPSSAARRMS